MTFDLKTGKKQRRDAEPALVPGAVISDPNVKREWSPQQLAIFKFASGGEGNLLARARAGTGKTTTSIEALKWFPPASHILFLAFNKAIANELTVRCQGMTNVRVGTCHSVGLSLVRRAQPGVQVDKDRGLKLAEMAQKALGMQVWREYTWAIKNLASISKLVAPFAKTATELLPIGYAYDCFGTVTGDEHIMRVCEGARKARELALEPNSTVDFDDMLFVAVRQPTTRGEYDVVMVDEAQDMNTAQLALAALVTKEGGRTFVIGDDRQAIYGFMGADKGSIDRLKKELKATELGLTVTYRCPKKVVALAQVFVPDLQAAKTAPEGVLQELEPGEEISRAQPGDFIISRTNAPLLGLCLELIAAGKPACVKGRDLVKRLVTLIERLQKRGGDLAQNAAQWGQEQMSKLKPEDDGGRQEVRDQMEVIAFLWHRYGTVQAMIQTINQLFKDDISNSVVCSTVHRVKGLEADRIFILTETFKGDFFLPTGNLESDNLKYVAVTRAKKELYLIGQVEEDDGERDDERFREDEP